MSITLFCRLVILISFYTIILTVKPKNEKRVSLFSFSSFFFRFFVQSFAQPGITQTFKGLPCGNPLNDNHGLLNFGGGKSYLYIMCVGSLFPTMAYQL